MRVPGTLNLQVKSLPKTLRSRFLVPPFSILDARNKEWQKRKRAWIDLGVKGGEGRGDKITASGISLAESQKRLIKFYEKCNKQKLGSTTVCATDWMKKGPDEGGSIFDPVLCEVMYKWFCPSNGSILDPFGGESVKGLVAAYLDYLYTGIELRKEQVEANRRQARKLLLEPLWVQGDSFKLNKILSSVAKFDFIFTSPPYYDLEIYSEDEKDGSAFETYEDFMLWYKRIFEQAVSHLKENRFLAVKVGEVRDKKTGIYRNFVGDNVTCFQQLGLHYYNEIILLTPIGSMPTRATRQFNAGKKLVKGHQNILIFFKGDPKNVIKALKQDFV